MIVNMNGLYVVGGKTIEVDDSTAAMMGFQRAPAPLETSVPFATVSSQGNTLGRRGGTGTATACQSLQARAQAYPGPDPLPAVRRALVLKCEAEQRAGATAAGAPDEYAPVSADGGIVAAASRLDTKTKIAIGVVGLLAVAVVAKKLKKR